MCMSACGFHRTKLFQRATSGTGEKVSQVLFFQFYFSPHMAFPNFYSTSEQPLEKEMATHFSILVWRIPWTEEPGRLHIVHRVARSRTRLSDAHSLTQSSLFFFFKKLYPCKEQWHLCPISLLCILLPFSGGASPKSFVWLLPRPTDLVA